MSRTVRPQTVRPPVARNVPPKASGPKAGQTVPPKIPNPPLGLKLILFGVPVVVFSSYTLYKRVFLGEEAKKQTGEMDENGKLRMFSEEEIQKRNSESIFVKIFGGSSK